MIVLYLILPLALLIAGAAVAAFAWTVHSGQLDDVDTPPRRILFDERSEAGGTPRALPAGRGTEPRVGSSAARRGVGTPTALPAGRGAEPPVGSTNAQ